MILEETIGRPLKVYFAGKVMENDAEDGDSVVGIDMWRNCVFNQKYSSCVAVGDERNIGIDIEYAGPTIDDCGHGFANPLDENGRRETVKRCLEQICASDLVYAYIDSKDTPGTLVELGFAHAVGRTIAICYSSQELMESLWFPKLLPEAVFFVCQDPEAGLRQLLVIMDQWYARMSYREYLKTKRWLTLSGIAKEAANYKCQVCNRGGEIHAHHRTYENRGNEKPGDLICLCADCHAKFHGK